MGEIHSHVVKDGDDECGTLTISLSEIDKDGVIQPKGAKAEGAMVFAFLPKTKETEKETDKTKKERKEDPKDCCGPQGFGWIQHQSTDSGSTWKYDNGAFKPPGPAPGMGAPSDPTKDPQQSEKDRPNGPDGTPIDSSEPGKQWKQNPWYGAQSKVPPDAGFDLNPKPQTTVADLPGGPELFRMQLVCANSGKVWLTWEWSKGNKGKQVPPPAPKAK